MDPEPTREPIPDAYPVSFSVEYQDRDLDRLTSFFRIFMVIPIVIIASLLAGPSLGYGDPDASSTTVVAGGAGVLFLPALLMILFRGKYPRWWFDWNLNLLRFTNRIGVYFMLMDDRYPSTDEEQGVDLRLPYPDVEADLHRGMPLVKWILALPHYVVLFFLWIGAIFAVLAAWFAILFTGRYPRALFNYTEGVLRWHNRVVGYAFALVTDRYPPFRLSA